MIQWLQQLQSWYFANEIMWQTLTALSAVFYLGILIIVPLVIIYLPARYLVENPINRPSRLRASCILFVIFKNILGSLFIFAGLIMLILPGQGLLTLGVGFMLIDFPAKKMLLMRIVRLRGVHGAINRMRAKASKPPLEVSDK